MYQMIKNFVYIAILLLPFYVDAQCNGSFGDPVFTETFGNDFATGNNIGPALPAGVTNYTYDGSPGDVQDGEYTIGINPEDALSNFFNTDDHTVDASGNGYMLIVNAAFAAGEFYRRTVTGLCEGQTFEFSAYLMNILPSTTSGCGTIVPNNVLFRVEDGSGNTLGELTTGNINSTTSPQWTRYAFDFQIPVGVSDIEVVLINNGPGGCGNDLAIDDISFRPCSNLSTVNAAYTDFANGICAGDNVDFTAVIEGNASTTLVYQWQESIDGGNNWTDIVGETTVNFSTSASIDGHQYRYAFSEAVNAGNPNCTILSEPITVNYYNISANIIDPISQCDLDGSNSEIFDLTVRIPQIINGDDPANYTITFHNSIADAQTGINPIPTPASFTPPGNPWDIYVYVESNTKGCASSTPPEFEISFYDAPVINTPITVQQCDDDTDGISIFNLNDVNELITTDPNLEITYYFTQTGAQNEDVNDEIDVADLPSFSNATASQVYATAKDPSDCFSVAEINLQVTMSQIPDNFLVYIDQCDDNSGGGAVNDGVGTFDLTDATNQIIATFPAADQPNLEVTYYVNENDALLDINPISNTTSYQNTTSPNSQNLFVRVTNLSSNNSCAGLGEHVTLNVSLQPEFEVESPQYICSNDLPKTLTVLNPQDDYTYVWYRNGDDLTGVVGLDIIAEVYNPGTYTVVATNANGSGCSTSQEIEVIASSIATITNIETEPGVLNSTITIDFQGESDEYEYNIDFGDFEDNNIVLLTGSVGEVYTYQTTIENPMGGNQTIRIRDKHGCGVAIEEVCVLGFPKFFTPTGDNINDRWQVFGAEECFDNAVVRIFDRYGKLMKQFSSGDEGWNGTYNGRQVPATDYWFTVEFADENFEVFKGHFSLKR